MAQSCRAASTRPAAWGPPVARLREGLWERPPADASRSVCVGGGTRGLSTMTPSRAAKKARVWCTAISASTYLRRSEISRDQPRYGGRPPLGESTHTRGSSRRPRPRASAAPTAAAARPGRPGCASPPRRRAPGGGAGRTSCAEMRRDAPRCAEMRRDAPRSPTSPSHLAGDRLDGGGESRVISGQSPCDLAWMAAALSSPSGSSYSAFSK